MDQILISVVFASLILALIFSRWPAPWLFAGAMGACYLMGLLDTQEILLKASNEGLATLIMLMLVSIGLERLPWLTALSSKLVVPSHRYSLLRITTVTAFFSALVNNTAVVAALAGTLRKNRFHVPSKLLIPLSYAAILGGTLTLIGTSTNLIVSSFLQDVSGRGLSFFATLPIALPAVIGGITVMMLSSRWMPTRDDGELKLDSYLIETEVDADSKLIGRSIAENGLRDLADLFLVEIVRGDELLSPVAPFQRIEAGDKLLFSGDITRVGTLERFNGLRLFAAAEGLLSANMTEVVVMPNAAVAGQTIKESAFRSRFDAAVVGLRRDGQQLSGKLGAIELQAGDSLMLAVGPDFRHRMNLRKNFLVVEQGIDSASLPLGISVFLSVALIAVILLCAMGFLALFKGMGFILAAMLALGVVTGSDLRRRFPFEIWLVITAALCVSQAMDNTGVVQVGVALLEPWLHGVHPYTAVVAVYLLTLLMTELMTNNAAAALVFPLAYSLALGTGVDPMPFVMAVAFGASASFLTPFGYATNLMVQNLGGYRRIDYLTLGAPVSLVYSAVVLALLPIMYPL